MSTRRLNQYHKCYLWSWKVHKLKGTLIAIWSCMQIKVLTCRLAGIEWVLCIHGIIACRGHCFFIRPLLWYYLASRKELWAEGMYRRRGRGFWWHITIMRPLHWISYNSNLACFKPTYIRFRRLRLSFRILALLQASHEDAVCEVIFFESQCGSVKKLGLMIPFLCPTL